MDDPNATANQKRRAVESIDWMTIFPNPRHMVGSKTKGHRSRKKTVVTRKPRAVKNWWKMTAYDGRGRVIGHYIGQGTRAEARSNAQRKLNRVVRHRRIQKVALNGPYKAKPQV
jgi:hypothetical protein